MPIDPALVAQLYRVGAYLMILIVAFGAGFIKGCEHVQADYKEAEVKYVERVKVVKEIERVEVPKYITKIETIETIRDRLIEGAKNEAPNPVTCDLSGDRVRRINQAATANP